MGRAREEPEHTPRILRRGQAGAVVDVAHFERAHELVRVRCDEALHVLGDLVLHQHQVDDPPQALDGDLHHLGEPPVRVEDVMAGGGDRKQAVSVQEVAKLAENAHAGVRG